MADRRTTWQKLTSVLINTGNGTPGAKPPRSVTYNMMPKNTVLFSSDNKEERDQKLAQLKQQRLMSYMWQKIGYESAMQQAVGSNQVRVMYRDADLMAAWPEIGSALDTLSEEATTTNKKGKILNIYSKSERIKSTLEDLFYNRLDINIWLQTIVRQTCKYGNEFMFLNLDMEDGVKGWRELPVHQMRRLENGMDTMYGGGTIFNANFTALNTDEVKFVWDGQNESSPFKSWMIAHFRLIADSLYLPYGVSWLNKARRHWRMLSMMEDGMLLYRLERSIQRRIFKVNVGLMDEADVEPFLQEFMNTVKRAPIIDPETGQIDLRKNFLDVSADYVIPVRNGQDPTSIDTLQSAENPTSMDDINYMENKILSALRVPKSFLNFQEAQGKGQNLSLLDIRFNRLINSIQKAIIMELNKVALIHLYLLGFEDDLTNFTLSLNNPSNQIEMMELDNMNKRLAAAQTALAEQGGGIPIMSWHQVQREIMGRTDREIEDTLNEIRLESALAIELQRTAEIIKRTHMFDKVDRIFGEPGAKYSATPPGQDGGMGGGAMGGGAPAPLPAEGGFGDELGDLGEPGADAGGDIGGAEGGADLGGMDAGGAPLAEGKKILREMKNSNSPLQSLFYDSYVRDVLTEEDEENTGVPILSKNLRINEMIESQLKSIDEEIKNRSKKDAENKLVEVNNDIKDEDFE